MLQQGFDWLTEAYDISTQTEESRTWTVLLEIMKNWKSENKDKTNSDMKRMFAKVDEIFKRNLVPQLKDTLDRFSS